MKKLLYSLITFFVVVTLVSGCGGETPSISIQPSTENFTQSSPLNIKLDILWVVDPSRSMFEETENVKANISSFMEGIVNAKFDYRVGFVSTSAWSDLAYQADPGSKGFLVDEFNRSVFNRLHSGECNNFGAADSNPNDFLSPLNAPDLNFFLQEFDTYFDLYGASLGTSGCGLVGPPFGTYQSVSNNIFSDERFNTSERSVLGEYLNDERPLQSLETFLNSGEGQSFVREDAFLAVVIITDEPDGSRDNLSPVAAFDPLQPGLHDANRYINFLDGVKGTSANYAVYSIIKQDGSNPLNQAIATESGGEIVDIDGTTADYATGLASIQQSILKESSLYLLGSEPVVETIQVTLIKGSSGEVIDVPADTGSGGFAYIAGVNGIKFLPPFSIENGDSIQVIYDKTSLAGGVSTSPPALALSNNITPENGANGRVVGQLSVVNVTGVSDLTYSLNSDSSNGGFAVSSSGVVTVANDSLLDRESQALEQINITANGSGGFELSSDILIILSDVIDAEPVANNDTFTVSEATANGDGDIIFTGSVSSNDAGIDSSEAHTFEVLQSPALTSAVSINNSGVFTFTVNRLDLTFPGGEPEDLGFEYRITDDTGTLSNIAGVIVKVLPFNEPPEVNTMIPIGDVVANGGGTTPAPVTLVGDSLNPETSSGFVSGDLSSAIDGDPATGFVTTASTNEAHFVTYDMEDIAIPGSELYQVTSVVLNGARSVGNTVIQVLSEDDKVLTREVLSFTVGDQSGTINFSTPVIGKKIKIIRPTGAENSDGDDNLQINEIDVTGIQAERIVIDLNNHFSDPDDPSSDAITYYATDVNGEGPAPGWATINGSNLVLVPPAGTNTDMGIVAIDKSGAAAPFVTFNVSRDGGGSTINSGPIALLAIDDTQRGGLTLNRYGGGIPGSGGPGGCGANSNQFITWDEGDDFIDQLLDENGDFIYPGAGNFDHLLDPDPNKASTDGHNTIEDGWDPIPTYVDNKYSVAGEIIPYDNSERCYGDTYTGYFVPDRTGLYRFRTTSLDDIVRLLVSTSEYATELQNIITGTIDTSKMRDVTEDSMNSGADFLGLSPQVSGAGNEFFPGTTGVALGSGHDTEIFFGGGVLGYQPGYVYLEKGNVYTFQIRFMEGGGSQRFDFQFDYREDGSPAGSWEDNWRPIDAIVTVPFSGTEGYSPVIVNSDPFVAFDSNELFYDAELDVLEYSVGMVNVDGTPYLGPGGTSNVSEIGLSFNSSTGLLSGSLNSVYENASVKPRVQFTATEKFTAGEQSVKSLVIKFSN